MVKKTESRSVWLCLLLAGCSNNGSSNASSSPNSQTAKPTDVAKSVDDAYTFTYFYPLGLPPADNQAQVQAEVSKKFLAKQLTRSTGGVSYKGLMIFGFATTLLQQVGFNLVDPNGVSKVQADPRVSQTLQTIKDVYVANGTIYPINTQPMRYRPLSRLRAICWRKGRILTPPCGGWTNRSKVWSRVNNRNKRKSVNSSRKKGLISALFSL